MGTVLVPRNELRSAVVDNQHRGVRTRGAGRMRGAAVGGPTSTTGTAGPLANGWHRNNRVRRVAVLQPPARLVIPFQHT